MNDSYSLSRFSLFVSSVVLASAVRLWKSVPNRKRIFRCVALDLDGTTLTSKHEVSDRTKRVLKQLETAGVKVQCYLCAFKIFDIILAYFRFAFAPAEV